MGASGLAAWRRAAIGLVAALMGGCVQPPPGGPVARVVGEGIIVCPPPTERCELSGATLSAGRLLLVNDRAVSGKVGDSVLEIAPFAFAPRIDARFLAGLPTLPAEKLEAITTTPDGRHVFATTSFDRPDPDRFNVLLTWPEGRPQAARALGSLALRAQLRTALASAAAPDGPAYFKIEGLAALPDRLLVGVRETGRTYQDFSFTLTVLSLPWHLENGVPVLAGPPRMVWRVDPARLPDLPKTPIGLSELAYDASRDRLWLLTSVERDEAVDSVAGYLWTLDLSTLASGSPPVLARGADGRPLLFTHKPEALAILPDDRLMVVHDDDRRATLVPDPATGIRRPRQQTEALYRILSVTD